MLENFLFCCGMRIYLDNCSFNHPYDDQNLPIVKLETEAKQFIQGQIILGNYELAWSYVLDFENNNNPFEEMGVKELSSLAMKSI